jgi:hypothetical protein
MNSPSFQIHSLSAIRPIAASFVAGSHAVAA